MTAEEYYKENKGARNGFPRRMVQDSNTNVIQYFQLLQKETRCCWSLQGRLPNVNSGGPNKFTLCLEVKKMLLE